jgi:hypothetical protein
MGGSAFLIHGSFDAERAVAAAKPTSLFGRLWARKSPSVSVVEFSVVELPNGRRLLEFPADAIRRPLARNYVEFVRSRLPAPSQSSRVVLGYLRFGQPQISLRGEQSPSDEQAAWYVQVSFTGAAGMAETSARVAAHWASHWYAARGETIRQILATAGFEPTRAEPLADVSFVPVGQYGYAEREDGVFAIDDSFLESHDDPEALLKELEQQYGMDLSRGQCRCELCQPRAPS